MAWARAQTVRMEKRRDQILETGQNENQLNWDTDDHEISRLLGHSEATKWISSSTKLPRRHAYHHTRLPLYIEGCPFILPRV